MKYFEKTTKTAKKIRYFYCGKIVSFKAGKKILNYK